MTLMLDSQSTTKRKRKAVKFDDVAIKGGALEQDLKEVAALFKKKCDYEAVAYEKAGHELRKVDQFDISLTQKLAEVQPRCTPAGFRVFKEMACPGLKRSRIDRLLLIGRGEKTLEQARAEDAARQRKSREKKKAAVTVTATAKPAALPAPAKLALPPPTKYTRPITRLAELIMVTDRLLPGLEPAEKQTFLTHVLNHPQMVGVKPLQKERK